MSLTRKVEKEDVFHLVKSLKKKIEKNNHGKKVYSLIYPVIDLINFIDGESIITGEIGAIITEGLFPPIGRTLVNITVPGEVCVDSNWYEILRSEVAKFTGRHNYLLFYSKKGE